MKEPKSAKLRIKYIKTLLKMPFHVFFRENDKWVFWIEDKKGEHLYWPGTTIVNSIEEGIEYVRHELTMGAIVDPDLKKTK